MRPRTLFDTELAGRLLGYEGRPRRDGRAAARAGPGEGPLRRRLVHPAAAARPGWRYAALDVEVLVELRDLLEARAARGRASWTGRGRSSPRWPPLPRRRRGPSRGGAPPASTGCATAARWPWSGRCGRPGTRWPASGTSRPAGCCRTARSSRPRSPTRRPPRSCAALPVFSGRQQLRQLPPLVRRDRRGARGCRTTALPLPAVPERRPAAGRTGGPTGTRTPPPGWPPPGPRWPTVRSGTRCPVENLLSPDLVRRLAWAPPARPVRDAAGGRQRLPAPAGGARAPWQVAARTAAPPGSGARQPPLQLDGRTRCPARRLPTPVGRSGGPG